MSNVCVHQTPFLTPTKTNMPLFSLTSLLTPTMASSSSSMFHVFMLSLLLLILHPQPSSSLTCSTQTHPKNKLFTHCTDLPTLNSYLHWTYNTSTLTIAFIAPPPKPNGWIAWAINPIAPKMIGSQALIAYKQDTTGSMTVKTFDISSYKIAPSKIAYEVPEMEAEVDGNGVMRIYASIILPKGFGPVVNQVWQVGASVANNVPAKHDFGNANLKAMGSLDLTKGGVLSPTVSDSRLKRKNTHGILNVVSWGILFPVGIIIARYLRAFQSADPAWFYLHVFCQCAAYAIGVAGWGTGLKLGSESKGVQYSTHRYIGITLFSLATLQIFALLLRPKKEHKYRTYWNFYHYAIGYAIVILGIINVFKGLDILVPEKKWRDAYVIVISVLGGISVLLEIITWIIVLKRRSNKSTKPYDGHNGA